MKIPERLNESRREQKFRQTQPMTLAYKLIDLDAPDCKKLYESAIIDVRVFWPDDSETCSAVIWIKDIKGKRYAYGIGETTGYGYHHESAAIQDAFEDMGIEFDRSFDGVGKRAQEIAICGVGEALGYKNTLLVDFNP